MGSSPEVLLLDDGELDDVQEALDAVGISYGRVRGSAIPKEMPAPSRLLVTTPRRIDAVTIDEDDDEDDSVQRIVVVQEDSPSLRSRLREIGFDYLVRRPVHPEALRLLLQHCVYAGGESRSEPRVPVGVEISFRTGLLPRRATLADLSTHGARILSKWALEPGKRISLTIPERSGVPDPIVLKGSVVRISLDERLGEHGPYSAGIAFDPVPAEARRELEWLLEERARGPATQGAKGEVAPGEPAPPEPIEPPESDGACVAHDIAVAVDVAIEEPSEEDATEDAAVATADPEVADDAADRRHAGRAVYERRVPAFGDRILRVLVARDLSARGMLVRRECELEIGNRLHVAVYGSPDDEPVLVWATVERDDGDRGLYLGFDELHPLVAEQIEKVVGSLPAVESLHDDEPAAMGTVVARVIDG